uniref:Gustatory receptor n=1 Tax=Panagrolaimus davidi TaxID=227884 RepID=A0A914PKV0_9BILA
MLLKINKRSYVTDYYERNRISKINLTKRYQTAENIRMLQTIISFLTYSTISNAITTSGYAFYVFYINENKLDDLFAYYDVVWYTINAVSACILPLPFILKHEGMKKHFMTLFGWSGLRYTPKTTQNLKSVNGTALITDNDPDAHFNNLKHLWQSA